MPRGLIFFQCSPAIIYCTDLPYWCYPIQYCTQLPRLSLSPSAGCLSGSSSRWSSRLSIIAQPESARGRRSARACFAAPGPGCRLASWRGKDSRQLEWEKRLLARYEAGSGALSSGEGEIQRIGPQAQWRSILEELGLGINGTIYKSKHHVDPPEPPCHTVVLHLLHDLLGALIYVS